MSGDSTTLEMTAQFDSAGGVLLFTGIPKAAFTGFGSIRTELADLLTQAPECMCASSALWENGGTATAILSHMNCEDEAEQAIARVREFLERRLERPVNIALVAA